MLSVSCEDNGVTSENISLAGNYDLVSMYNKDEQITYVAGQPIIKGMLSVTMSGDLVLTDKTYSTLFETKVTIGDSTETTQLTDHGTYEIIDDSNLKCISEENNGTTSMSYLVQDDNLTLEDENAKTVWKKR